MLGQRGCVVWFTGLSGSGKSTVACTVEHELARRGSLTALLDGDNVRHGLNKVCAMAQIRHADLTACCCHGICVVRFHGVSLAETVKNHIELAVGNMASVCEKDLYVHPPSPHH